ncbi:hypothetical protein [Candidatus Vallotia lariciata]|uniref:hypothetical protein n=1 Tax=Candidatus Vallotia laricis TaxID=2018052 RepID=UPI001D014826|nr:hypothetical protein [Candidatus Vallotia lariciata]UDG83098.1 hypothetical protein GKR41_00475 [Candidatus Vallotia lariciata]
MISFLGRRFLDNNAPPLVSTALDQASPGYTSRRELVLFEIFCIFIQSLGINKPKKASSARNLLGFLLETKYSITQIYTIQNIASIYRTSMTNQKIIARLSIYLQIWVIYHYRMNSQIQFGVGISNN